MTCNPKPKTCPELSILTKMRWIPPNVLARANRVIR